MVWHFLFYNRMYYGYDIYDICVHMIKDIRDIGVKEGDTLDLKVSLKSMDNITARGLIRTLLYVVGPKGTLITNSFVDAHPLSLLRRRRIVSHSYSTSYAGGVANAMIDFPGAYRSRHPIQKFAAVGYRAKELMYNHTPDSFAYDVLKILAETGGKNLSIGPVIPGVGTPHVAIGILGMKQSIPKTGIYYMKDNKEELFKRDWVGGCSDGFRKFNHKAIGRGKIGGADSALYDMGDSLRHEIGLLKADPSFFMCGKCIDCRYSWDHSPGNKTVNRIMINLLRTYNGLK